MFDTVIDKFLSYAALTSCIILIESPPSLKKLSFTLIAIGFISNIWARSPCNFRSIYVKTPRFLNVQQVHLRQVYTCKL